MCILWIFWYIYSDVHEHIFYPFTSAKPLRQTTSGGVGLKNVDRRVLFRPHGSGCKQYRNVHSTYCEPVFTFD